MRPNASVPSRWLRSTSTTLWSRPPVTYEVTAFVVVLLPIVEGGVPIEVTEIVKQLALIVTHRQPSSLATTTTIRPPS